MCKARFERNSTVRTGTEHNPAIHVKRMEAQQGSSSGTRSRSGTCLSHNLQENCEIRVAQSYVLHTVPSDEAARCPISRQSQAGLRHHAQLHLRIAVYWRSICHMAASVAQPQPHPHPRSPVGLPSSPCPPLLVNCSLLHITRNPRSLRCRPACVRVESADERERKRKRKASRSGVFTRYYPGASFSPAFLPTKPRY